MGDRVVKHSLTPAAMRVRNPTVTREMVLAEDPKE